MEFGLDRGGFGVGDGNDSHWSGMGIAWTGKAWFWFGLGIPGEDDRTDRKYVLR